MLSPQLGFSFTLNVDRCILLVFFKIVLQVKARVQFPSFYLEFCGSVGFFYGSFIWIQFILRNLTFFKQIRLNFKKLLLALLLFCFIFLLCPNGVQC